SLWTSWNSGGANGVGKDAGGPEHFAPPGSSAVVNGFTYYGAYALMNGSGSSRSILSDIEVQELARGYDYKVVLPSSFGTMYDTLDADGTLRINTTNLTNSDDFAEISTSGNQLLVSLALGNPVPGIDPHTINSSFPLGAVTRITIDLGQGN